MPFLKAQNQGPSPNFSGRNIYKRVGLDILANIYFCNFLFVQSQVLKSNFKNLFKSTLSQNGPVWSYFMHKTGWCIFLGFLGYAHQLFDRIPERNLTLRFCGMWKWVSILRVWIFFTEWDGLGWDQISSSCDRTIFWPLIRGCRCWGRGGSSSEVQTQICISIQIQ